MLPQLVVSVGLLQGLDGGVVDLPQPLQYTCKGRNMWMDERQTTPPWLDPSWVSRWALPADLEGDSAVDQETWLTLEILAKLIPVMHFDAPPC